MSVESFNAFMAKVEEDQQLRDKLRAAGGDVGLPVQALAEFAGRHGYSFTAEDVTGELSDAQLEGVAGGMGRMITGPTRFDYDKISPTLSVKSMDSGLMFKLT
jgi:predicted ribosomally synthesized peptide with nif11-like leader